MQGPDTEPGKRVTGAGARTDRRKATEERTVHQSGGYLVAAQYPKVTE